MYYKFDISKLIPGDILLSRGAGLQANIISKVTGGNFSHAMLYVGGTVIHADGNGVYSRNPQRIYAKDKDDLAVYRLKEKISKNDIEKICKTARAEVGKLYDLKGAVSSVINGADRSRGNRQFCSKLVAHAYESINISFGKKIDKITPNDFSRSELLKIKDHIIPMSESDFQFAKSPDYNLDLQIETFEWLSKAREFALKKRKRIIGSINNVFEYLIDFPEDDQEICKIVDGGRYYGFSNIDREKNPHRYDLNLLKEHVSALDEEEKLKFVTNELVGLDYELITRKNNYFWAIRLISEVDILFFRKNHELSKNLYMNVTRRAHVINLMSEYRVFLENLHNEN